MPKHKFGDTVRLPRPVRVFTPTCDYILPAGTVVVLGWPVLGGWWVRRQGDVRAVAVRHEDLEVHNEC